MENKISWDDVLIITNPKFQLRKKGLNSVDIIAALTDRFPKAQIYTWGPYSQFVESKNSWEPLFASYSNKDWHTSKDSKNYTKWDGFGILLCKLVDKKERYFTVKDLYNNDVEIDMNPDIENSFLEQVYTKSESKPKYRVFGTGIKAYPNSRDSRGGPFQIKGSKGAGTRNIAEEYRGIAQFWYDLKRKPENVCKVLSWDEVVELYQKIS